MNKANNRYKRQILTFSFKILGYFVSDLYLKRVAKPFLFKSKTSWEMLTAPSCIQPDEASGHSVQSRLATKWSDLLTLLEFQQSSLKPATTNVNSQWENRIMLLLVQFNFMASSVPLRWLWRKAHDYILIWILLKIWRWTGNSVE